MLNEKLIKNAGALMRARAAYFKDGEQSPRFKEIYDGLATGYAWAADILQDAINGNTDILNMKWAGYEKYDPRLKSFELWDVGRNAWPREGDYFRVGEYEGRCVLFEVDYENTSATAWMLVED